MTAKVEEPAPRRPERLATWHALGVFALIFGLVAGAHAALLRLPYYWDEGGYYIPAALDFYHRWTLIPEFTNAHPPLPNVVLGLLWHLFGYHILVTRLTACAFAAGGLLAIWVIGRKLLGTGEAVALTLLTAVYPIWFAQSSLAHADIFAAGLTLGGLAVFFTSPEQLGRGTTPVGESRPGRLIWTTVLLCLSVLAKETAVVQPVALAGMEALLLLRSRPDQRGPHLRWLAVFCAPVPVLATWFGYHRWKTGFTFGNPVFLRYNATANLTLAHITQSLRYRFIHLFWQRNIWVALLLAAACLLFLSRRPEASGRGLPRPVLRTIAVLLLANWIAFSVLGGALLTRYLLPVYPLLLLVCVSIWQTRTPHWPWLAALTGAAFAVALWFNPPTNFAPEDNLTYRDMILVHQEAIAYLNQHDPDATVLTAWPATAEITRPDLGYTQHRFKVVDIENFTRPEVAKAAENPGKFDAALVFTTRYTAPALRRYLQEHPQSARARAYEQDRDLSPPEIARILGGIVVWQDDRGGEWAAVLRFNRRYDASMGLPSRPGPLSGLGALSSFRYTRAPSPSP